MKDNCIDSNILYISSIVAALPAWCSGNGDCERGSPISAGLGSHLKIVLAISGSILFLIISSLALVCFTAFCDRRVIRMHESNVNSAADCNGESGDNHGLQTSSPEQSPENRDQTTITSQQHKASNNFIIFQAFAYVGAFSLTVIFPILILSSNYIMPGDAFHTHREVIKKLQLVFQPLQGFFNFCIFFSSKVYQQLNKDRSQSYITAMKKVFAKDYDDPVFISQLSVVRNTENHRETNELRYNNMIEDDEIIEDDLLEEVISYPSAKTPSFALSGDVSGLSGFNSGVELSSQRKQQDLSGLQAPVASNTDGSAGGEPMESIAGISHGSSSKKLKSSSGSVFSSFSWFSRSTNHESVMYGKNNDSVYDVSTSSVATSPSQSQINVSNDNHHTDKENMFEEQYEAKENGINFSFRRQSMFARERNIDQIEEVNEDTNKS